MTHHSHAYGLDLSLPHAVCGLPVRRPDKPRPRLAVTLGAAREADAAWGTRTARRVVELAGEGRSPELVVDARGASYRIDWRGVGQFVLPGDDRLVSTIERGSGDHWERLLLGQVLPLAATLAGVELLHASGVALDGLAVGIAGPSGVGKSTLACAMADRGGTFLADDALGLTREGGAVMAHPGPALARLAPGRSAIHTAGIKAGRVLGERSQPSELGVLILIRRTDAVRRPAFQQGAEFAQLAGATFNLLVQTEERLRRQLDLCAELDASGRVWRLELPNTLSPAQAGEVIADHARSLPPWAAQ